MSSVASPRPPQLPMKGNRFGKREPQPPASPAAAAAAAPPHVAVPNGTDSPVSNGGAAHSQYSDYANGDYANYNSHAGSNGVLQPVATSPTVPPRPKKAGIAPPIKPSKTSTMTLHRNPPPQHRVNTLQRTVTAPHPPAPPSSHASPIQPQMSHPFPLSQQQKQMQSQPQVQGSLSLHRSQTVSGVDQQQLPAQARAPLNRSATAGTISPTPPSQAQAPKKKMTKAEKREKVAHEIVSTEETYVTSLKVLSSLYIKPLMDLANANKPVLSRKQIDVIFSNISLILPLNQKFKEDLASRVADWDAHNSTVADVFRDFAPYFKMYTSYVNNHDNAVEALKKELENNEKFCKFCETAERHPDSGAQKLASYLILPIQRIPRYRLLLQEMEKNTEESHPYLQAEEEALKLVKEVAEQINESVRQQANRAQIISIQERFQGDVTFVEPSRRFIREGVLTKVCRSTDKKYMFFLFSDLLVYASRGFKLKLHSKIPIGNLFGFSDLEDTPAVKHRFSISSQNKSFVVYAEDKATKNRWLLDLTNVSVEVQKTLSHDNSGTTQQLAPVWQPDGQANECQVCRASFSVFKRRHHCRRCGKLVCNDCSKTRAILTANDKNKIQRVCDDCIVLLKRRDAPQTGAGGGPGDTGDSSGESDSEDEQEVLCKAMYEYVADDERELTIRKGDIIRVVHRDPSGWWTGELGSQVGIFPSTYTQIIEQDAAGRDPYQYDPNSEANGSSQAATHAQQTAAAATSMAAAASAPSAASTAAPNSGGGAAGSPQLDMVVVTTAYEAAGQGELTLNVGDRIYVKNRDPSGWWCGRLESNDEVGWFSPEFVEACDDAMSDTMSEASSISAFQPRSPYVPAGGSHCPDCTCSGFRPNTFRPNLCCECWHAEAVHTG